MCPPEPTVGHDPAENASAGPLAAVATAWAESGATLGEVYHAVALALSSNSNRSLAVTAASCSTIGLGGHISGADNVLDALLVDAVGRVLDRRAMGEDVF